MRYNHVIFDLDGTLLDTLEDLTCAGNHMCEMRGWPTYTQDQFRYKVGNGQLKLVERLIPAEFAGQGGVFEQALADFRAYYGAHKEDHTAPYPGIIEMLDRLREQGVSISILSNKDHAATEPLAQRYFGDRFDVVQGRIDAFPPKPAAPITLHVLDLLEADPATTLYVGDSNVDIACGHNAGLHACGVAWGFRGRIELEEAGADYVIEDPSELLDIVLD